MVEFNTEIPYISKPNRNYRIYSKECIEKMTGTHFITRSIDNESDGSIPINTVCGECEAVYDEHNDSLKMRIRLFESIDLSNVYIVPCGFGNVDSDGNVSEFKMIDFSLSGTTSFDNQKPIGDSTTK